MLLLFARTRTASLVTKCLAACVHTLPVIVPCIVLCCYSCCCWHAGIEVDAMRTVAKAYQDRSLQVSHTFPCHC